MITDWSWKGIDVQGVRIVVQYKATCDLCTLWQRFGRAARGADEEAIAILLVEKKDTEEERLAKATKRKATEEINSQPAKRPALADRTLSNMASENVNRELSSQMALSESNLDDHKKMIEERRAHYGQQASGQRQKVKKTWRETRTVEVGSAMDDFINAHLHIHCRRLVLTIYFQNDKAGEHNGKSCHCSCCLKFYLSKTEDSSIRWLKYCGPNKKKSLNFQVI